jgi:hypothetical protein
VSIAVKLVTTASGLAKLDTDLPARQGGSPEVIRRSGRKAEQMSDLFAFQVAKEVPFLSPEGHYDASRQQWVGDGTPRATTVTPDGPTFRFVVSGSIVVGTPTGPIDFPRIEYLG